MRIKKVNRYYCDFCKKSGGSSGAMKKHEAHCTMNPSRDCRMCKSMDEVQSPIKDLLKILPDPKTVVKLTEMEGGFVAEDWEPLKEALKVSFPRLRKVTGGCPMCILAALRQKEIPGYIGEECGFKYKDEIAEIWKELNKEPDEYTYSGGA